MGLAGLRGISGLGGSKFIEGGGGRGGGTVAVLAAAGVGVGAGDAAVKLGSCSVTAFGGLDLK